MSPKRLLHSHTVDGQERLWPYVKNTHNLRSVIRRPFRAWTLKGRREHNQTNLISRLPPEVLLEVFLCLCSTFSASRVRPGSWHWYKIAHICHNWRELAISSPPLWGRIDVDWPAKFVQLLIARSRDAPLGAKCGFRRHGLENLKELIDRHGGRLHALDITDFGLSWLQNTLNSMGECPLVSLSIRRWDNKPHTYAWLPNSPFVANLRQLSCLSLNACAFEWSSPVYHSAHLTSLELLNIPPGLQPSAEQFFTVLTKNATRLMNLVLVRLELTQFDSLLDCPQGVKAPFLQTLRLDNSCLRIIESLILPPTMSFDIVDRTTTSTVANSLQLARAFRVTSRFTSARIVTGSVFELRSEGPRKQRLRLERGDSTFWEYNGLTTLRCFSLENLTELNICGFAKGHSVAWGKSELLACRKEWQIIFGLAQLRLLTLTARFPALCLETLFECAMLCIGIGMEAMNHQIGADTVGKPLLKKLARIEFFNCNFDVGLRDMDTKPVDLLVAILWARQQCNELVPTVHFEGSGPIGIWKLQELRRLTKVSRGHEEAWGLLDGPHDHHAMAMKALEQLALLYQGPERPPWIDDYLS